MEILFQCTLQWSLRWGLRFWFSCEFPGAALVVGPWTRHGHRHVHRKSRCQVIWGVTDQVNWLFQIDIIKPLLSISSMWGIIRDYMKVNLFPFFLSILQYIWRGILKRSSFPQGHRNDPSWLNLLICPLCNMVFKCFLWGTQRECRLG